MPIVHNQPPPAAAGENPASIPHGAIGHNEPPIEEQIGMEFREALLSEQPGFLDRMDKAIEAVERAAVVDDETLGKAGDLDKILRACGDHISKVHKAVKEPHLARTQACDAEKSRLIHPITDARFRLKDAMNGYLAEREAAARAEQARRAAEQRAAQEAAERAQREAREAEEAAARAAAEAKTAEEREAAARAAAEAQALAEEAIAAAPLAAAAPARPEPVRSDAGSTVSSRKEWQSEVVDYQVAFMAVEDNPKVREAIDKAVAKLVKAGKTKIEGVKIWQAVIAVSR